MTATMTCGRTARADARRVEFCQYLPQFGFIPFGQQLAKLG